MKLVTQRYGKARVRVMKVTRNGSQHELKEVEVSVMLEGDFAASYLSGDNSLVVATDTMKNTINALAKEDLRSDIEQFGIAIGRHFLKRYPQVGRATITLREHLWQRMQIDGRPHPHSFLEGAPARPWAQVLCSRESTTVESGIQNLLILKTTESGFEGYAKDEYTTLPETSDRILATNLEARWLYQREPADYARANRAILDAMLKVFALNYSPSVQTTLFQMGKAALDDAPEISRIHLVMPNKHCLLVNLAPFGLENKNEIFVPTDEPHGQIEATIARDSEATT